MTTASTLLDQNRPVRQKMRHDSSVQKTNMAPTPVSTETGRTPERPTAGPNSAGNRGAVASVQAMANNMRASQGEVLANESSRRLLQSLANTPAQSNNDPHRDASRECGANSRSQ